MCVDILLAMMKTRRSRHKTTELYLHVDLHTSTCSCLYEDGCIEDVRVVFPNIYEQSQLPDGSKTHRAVGSLSRPAFLSSRCSLLIFHTGLCGSIIVIALTNQKVTQLWLLETRWVT